MSSRSLTAVPIPPAKGTSIGDNRAAPAKDCCGHKLLSHRTISSARIGAVSIVDTTLCASALGTSGGKPG
jgi:hypothetical protein